MNVSVMQDDKNELENGLSYSIPPKIIKMITIALNDGEITNTERNYIITKAEEVGISSDDINQYLDNAIEKYNAAHPTQSTKEATQQTNGIGEEDSPFSFGWVVFVTVFIVGLLVAIGIISHDDKMFGRAFQFGMVMVAILAAISDSNSRSGSTTKSEGNSSSTQEPCHINKESQDPIPQSIKEKIASAIANNQMTFAKKVELIQLAEKENIKQSLIEKYINRALRKHLSNYPSNELQRCPDCKEFITYETQLCPFCGYNLIWRKIKGLTMLALSDRVLTDLERKTIVKTAIQGGIKPNEINEYLFNALNQRLKSYTKVDLRDCPYCGAQIPLVSDECLYCGKPLEHIEGSNTVPFKISGPEAKIIVGENLRIEEERHNLKECPDCGAPFPLISNICPSCGHVLHERYENKLNIKNLLDNIMKSINRVNDAPKPKVYQILGYWLYYIILIMSVLIFIMALVFNSEVGKLIAMAGFCLSIVAVIFAPHNIRDSHTPAQVADGEYYKARYAYEMYARQVETLYGDDPEAKPLLNKFASAIKRLKRERYQNRKRVTVIISLIAMVMFGIIAFFSSQKETEKPTLPPQAKVWNIPSNANSVLSLTKVLKPYPPESGVEPRLSYFISANDDAHLTFVLADNDEPVYHWKINRLELNSTGVEDNENYSDYSLKIELLDSNYKRIGTMSESRVSEHNNGNYHKIISRGNGHYYADFWSEHGTNSDTIIQIIMQKAQYYTISSNKPKPKTKKKYGR